MYRGRIPLYGQLGCRNVHHHAACGRVPVYDLYCLEHELNLARAVPQTGVYLPCSDERFHHITRILGRGAVISHLEPSSAVFDSNAEVFASVVKGHRPLVADVRPVFNAVDQGYDMRIIHKSIILAGANGRHQNPLPDRLATAYAHKWASGLAFTHFPPPPPPKQLKHFNRAADIRRKPEAGISFACRAFGEAAVRDAA